METPRVNAVGIVEYPEGYVAAPRRVPPVVRVAAALLIALFGFVVVTTTVVSVGSYCLTSDGGDVRELPD
jgi:hypothetical protein